MTSSLSSPQDGFEFPESKFQIHSQNEFESAFEKMQQEDLKAVIILDDGMLQANVTAIAALATKRNLLSIGNKELTQAGGGRVWT